MAFKIGKNRDENDTVTVSTATINSTTATKLLDANANRISVTISFENDVYPENWQTVYIREYAAATDNTKKGVPLYPGGCVIMETNAIYPGEISAISEKSDVTLQIQEK